MAAPRPIPGLFDGQHIHKAGDVKDLHDVLVDMGYHHPALLVHGLLQRQQHPQTGGGNIGQLFKIQGQGFNSLQLGAEGLLQLWGSGGVQPSGQLHLQGISVLIQVNVHHDLSFMWDSSAPREGRDPYLFIILYFSQIAISMGRVRMDKFLRKWSDPMVDRPVSRCYNI